MKHSIMQSVFLLFPFFGFAQPILCELKINSATQNTLAIESILDQKVLITKSAEVVAYLTQKQKTFVIEAFLTQYDARIYAEGKITNLEDQLTASLWGRDILIDISCAMQPTADLNVPSKVIPNFFITRRLSFFSI